MFSSCAKGNPDSAAADPALRAWVRPFPAPGTGASACRLDVGDKDLSRVVESISEQVRGEPVGSGSDP